MSLTRLIIPTQGEQFYDITARVKDSLELIRGENLSGLLNLFIQHTSCALTINESYDPSAREDMEEFLRHLAPRNLKFIKHDDEGPDDSPSHMKSMLIQNSITIPVEKGQLLLGQWQGIYLCEFRDAPKERSILLKFLAG